MGPERKTVGWEREHGRERPCRWTKRSRRHGAPRPDPSLLPVTRRTSRATPRPVRASVSHGPKRRAPSPRPRARTRDQPLPKPSGGPVWRGRPRSRRSAIGRSRRRFASPRPRSPALSLPGPSPATPSSHQPPCQDSNARAAPANRRSRRPVAPIERHPRPRCRGRPTAGGDRGVVAGGGPVGGRLPKRASSRPPSVLSHRKTGRLIPRAERVGAGGWMVGNRPRRRSDGPSQEMERGGPPRREIVVSAYSLPPSSPSMEPMQAARDLRVDLPVGGHSPSPA